MESMAGSDRGGGHAVAAGGAVGVVVLGAGRSGTSAVTRALLAAGFFAGEEGELLGPVPSNPLGHYEPLPVLEANEELLARFGCAWGGDAPSPEQQLAVRDEVVPRLRSVLDRLLERAAGAPLAVKEPRINLLLPIWRPVIEGRLHPVLAVRDPLEVAFSVADRDGTSVGQALASWETQVALALDWLDGRTATVVPYAALIERPELAGEIVREAASHLGPERAGRVDPERAAAALRPDLRRQSAAGVPHEEYLTQHQGRIWKYVSSLPIGDVLLEPPEEVCRPGAGALAETHRESERVRLAMGHQQATARIGAVEDRLAACAQELERVRRSASWRLTAPLRRLSRLRRRA